MYFMTVSDNEQHIIKTIYISHYLSSLQNKLYQQNVTILKVADQHTSKAFNIITLFWKEIIKRFKDWISLCVNVSERVYEWGIDEIIHLTLVNWSESKCD